MRFLPAKLVAIVLLLMQGWIGIGRGQVFCVPMHGLQGDCGEVAAAACECCCDESHGHEHSAPVAVAGHEPCGCCLHLPTPDPDQLPQPRSGVECGAKVVVAVLPLVVFDLTAAVQLDRSWWHPPPDPASLAQVRGLKCTRLNI